MAIRFRPPNRTVWISVLLCVLTLAAYWPTLHNQFIGLDDEFYILRNPHVTTGLSGANLAWAFQTGYLSNWHPLTWISHMADVQFFGLRPGWHHLINLLLHVANSLLLFLWLRRWSGAEWRSAMVAALFALHPLHVESVAWVAERKDLLSGLFFFATLWAYAEYAAGAGGKEDRRPRAEDRGARGYYSLALGLYALGLMSKPMLVTVPFVLLLLDVWPLRRLRLGPSQEIAAEHPAVGWRLILAEKAPFLVLALVSSIVTYLAQKAGEALILDLPLSRRLVNAVVSYVKYLGKTIWPVDLAIFYPHPDTRWPATEQWPLWAVCLAALGLGALAWYAWRQRRDQPWLAVGGCWFLGMLVPVIGVVQVGEQAMADRYTYLPLIGVFIALVWGAAEILKDHWRRETLAVSAGVGLAACTAVTHRQIGYWHDTLTVFNHALEVTANNPLAHFEVGSVLGGRGQFAEAAQQFQETLRADPRYSKAHYSLGMALEALDKPVEAVAEYRAALTNTNAARPEQVRNRLGAALWALGRHDEALEQYAEALRLAPEYAQTYYNLGVALSEMDRTDEATVRFVRALELQPDIAEDAFHAAQELLSRDRLKEAEPRFAALARLFPEETDALICLGQTLAKEGRFSEAAERFAAAGRLSPTNATLRVELGQALNLAGQTNAAATAFAEADRLDPGLAERNLQMGQSLAAGGEASAAEMLLKVAFWLRPHSAEASEALGSLLLRGRKLPEAIALLEQAARLKPAAAVCRRLAAAYAGAGQFTQALQAAEQAHDLAVSGNAGDLAREIQSEIEQYRRHEAAADPKQ